MLLKYGQKNGESQQWKELELDFTERFPTNWIRFESLKSNKKYKAPPNSRKKWQLKIERFVFNNNNLILDSYFKYIRN